MNPPVTLLEFKDEELLSWADETQNTRERAALIDVVKLRRKVLELKGQLRRRCACQNHKAS